MSYKIVNGYVIEDGIQLGTKPGRCHGFCDKCKLFGKSPLITFNNNGFKYGVDMMFFYTKFGTPGQDGTYCNSCPIKPEVAMMNSKPHDISTVPNIKSMDKILYNVFGNII